MTINRRRLSTMSARAPAGNASSISGKLSAASTSATIEGDEESEVINQPAPKSCIHEPTFETMVAIHRLRKSAFCNGLHGERPIGDCGEAGTGRKPFIEYSGELTTEQRCQRQRQACGLEYIARSTISACVPKPASQTLSLRVGAFKPPGRRRSIHRVRWVTKL